MEVGRAVAIHEGRARSDEGFSVPRGGQRGRRGIFERGPGL